MPHSATATRPPDERRQGWESWRDKHEAVCTERWQNVNSTVELVRSELKDVKEIQQKIFGAIVLGLGATVTLLLSLVVTLLVSGKAPIG